MTQLSAMSLIHVDDVPYVEFTGDQEWLAAGPLIKRLAPSDSGVHFIVFLFPADYEAPEHWHDYDTIYIVKSGEFHVDGEGCFRPGDVRWVRGGTAYGSERAGPQGCEVYIISMGPIALRNPQREPPPRGYGSPG